MPEPTFSRILWTKMLILEIIRNLLYRTFKGNDEIVFVAEEIPYSWDIILHSRKSLFLHIVSDNYRNKFTSKLLLSKSS